MADVVRWVDTQEVDEVRDLLEAAGRREALQAARATWLRDERQRSSVYTTAETILEPFAEPVVLGRRGRPPLADRVDRIDPGELLLGAAHAYLCAPAHDQRRLRAFRRARQAGARRGLQPVGRGSARPARPAPAGGARRGGQHRPVGRARRPRCDLCRPRGPAGDGVAGPGADLRPLRRRAATVVNNHRAKIFLSGIADPGTLDHASHLVGDEELLVPSVTAGRGRRPVDDHAPAAAPPAPAGRAPPAADRVPASSSTARCPGPAGPPAVVGGPGTPKRGAGCATAGGRVVGRQVGRFQCVTMGREGAGQVEGPSTPMGPCRRSVSTEAILRRRDVRAEFTGQPIPPGVARRMLEAAHAAPSVGLTQPWDFLLVSDPAVRRSFYDHVQPERATFAGTLSGTQPERFAGIKIDGIIESTLSVVVTYDRAEERRASSGGMPSLMSGLYSVCLAIENLWLGATAEGLGMGWVSFYREPLPEGSPRDPEHHPSGRLALSGPGLPSRDRAGPCSVRLAGAVTAGRRHSTTTGGTSRTDEKPHGQ